MPDGRADLSRPGDSPESVPRRVLVTGGTRGLGLLVAERMRARGHGVRTPSRRTAPRLDLATGEGVDAAVDGVATVVHCASDPVGSHRETDVEGTGRLLAAARAAGVGHFLYVSIVGVDRAAGAYPYYRAKLDAEQLVAASGVPWTIVRATQFHDLIPRRFFPRLRRFGIQFVPRGWRVQPVAVEEVAERVVALAEGPPAGMAPELGGPEVLTWEEIGRAWTARRGTPMLVVPVPGGLSRAFRSGAMLSADRSGRRRWSQWLEEQP